MKHIKWLAVGLAAVLTLVFGAVTGSALAEEPQWEKTPVIIADYAAEEMAVGDYYENWSPEG